MDKKIKILFAIDCMNIGGAPTVVFEQSKAMDDKKFDIHLMTLYRSRSVNYLNRLEYLQKSRFTQLFLNKKNLLFSLKNWNILYRFLKTEKFDVVYTHLFITNLMVRLVAIMVRVPLVLSFEHSFYNAKSSFSKFFDRILSKFTYKIIVPNQEIANYTAEYERIDINKFFILPNPISVPPKDTINKDLLKKELGLPSDSLVIITLGRFSKEKCQEYFIKIAEKTVAKISNAYFLLIGYGPLENELKEEIKKRNLNERCKMIIEPEKAKNFLHIGDIFASTSAREGQPLSVLEAMKAELAVISFVNNGAESLIKNKKNGYLIPFGNVDMFVDQLIFLCNNFEIRKELVSEAKIDLEYFDVSKNIKKLENLIIEFFEKNK